MSRESSFAKRGTTARGIFSRGLCSTLLLVAGAGCTHARHSVEPYRSDAAAGTSLSERAQSLCAAKGHGDARALERPFVTDGCSMWPDGAGYVGCCVEHDLHYWCGGTREERLAADQEFGVCVAQTSSIPGLGTFMKWGVRFGGHPIFPVPYRWGYGHAYRWGYPAPDGSGE